MKKALIALVIVSIAYCEDLSAEENNHRLKTCGKPSVAAPTSSEEQTPWTLRTHAYHGKDYYYNSVLVSQRHVIVANAAFFGRNSDKWLDDEKFPVDRTRCKENIMQIPGGVLDKMYVEMSSCSNIDRCGFQIQEQIVKGYYIGGCAKKGNDYGFGVLEMFNNVPNKTYFQPICIPENSGTLKKGEAVELHGHFKQDSHYVRKASSNGCRPNTHAPDYAICVDVSLNDSHFSVVRKENERSTLLGMQSVSWNNPDHAHFTSIGYFREKLCDLVGICSLGVKRKPVLSDIKESEIRKKKFRRLPEDDDVDFSSSLDSTLVILTTIIVLMIMN